MPRKWYWRVAVPSYFGIVVWFLRKVEPGSLCLYCGAFPPFWGAPVAPREYFLHKSYHDALFFMRYLVVGAIITACGCLLAPAVVSRFGSRTLRAAAAFVATPCALLLIAITSDVCSLLRLWGLPMFILHLDFDPFIIRALSETFLPPALMSAVLELGGSEQELAK